MSDLDEDFYRIHGTDVFYDEEYFQQCGEVVIDGRISSVIGRD